MRTTTWMSGGLRILTASVLVTTAIATGARSRSLWSILLLGAAFALAYVGGKRPAWQLAWRQGGPIAIVRAFALTTVIQTVVVTVFYLIGYGAAAIFDANQPPHPLARIDGLVAAVLGGLGLLVGFILDRLEIEVAPSKSSPDSETEQLLIDPTPVTEQTFYSARHFLHGAPDDERWVTQPGMIEAAEERLGITFPPRLRRLYERQNGGIHPGYYVALVADPRPVYDDYRAVLSVGYQDLRPLDELITYRDHYMDGSSGEEAENELPEGADRWIVLSWFYSDCTILDYSQPGEPSILIKDFAPDSDRPDVRFPTFDAFFAALRREA